MFRTLMDETFFLSDVLIRSKEWIVLYGLRVLAALAILAIGWLLAKTARRIIRKMLIRGRVDNTLVSFVSSIVYVGILVVVVIASLGQLGVETASFIAILGAAGLAIGLALQGSLSNFAAGVLMILFKPFKSGDFVEAGGATGIVSEIKILTTVLISLDNKKIIVPNNKVMSDNIINHTALELRRIELIVGISYGDDVEKVKKVLFEILKNESRILTEPSSFIGVHEMADNSVNMAIWAWVKTTDYLSVLFELREKIKVRFDKEGITIPFPQRDVHITYST